MSIRNFKPFSENAKSKPPKPREDFPLFPHANGTWAKKIRGKMHYFGPWSDPDAVLEKYLKEKDDLHAGRTPRERVSAGVVVKDVVNAFLAHKQDKLNARELSPRTWAKYKEVADLLVQQFGKNRLVSDLRPDDFAKVRNAMAAKWGPLRITDFIQHIRSVFKYAYEAEMIDRPLRFGPGFVRPSKQVIVRHKAKRSPKMFEADEVRNLLDAAGVQMRALILLGVNCGFGNADCGTLPMTALDLKCGVVDFPRPKTGVGRRCPLWSETVEAIRAALAQRPTPKSGENASLAFLSQRGTPLVSIREMDRTDGVAVQFSLLLKRLGMAGRGLSFYCLRDTFRTIADEARDQVACDHIMGHSDGSMASHYRERLADARLKAVSDHVRAWLFAEPKKAAVDTAEERTGDQGA